MKRTIFGLGAWALIAACGAQAQDAVRKDVLLIDRMEKAAHQATPVNGVTMDQVSQSFGEPASKVPPVGDPPISRWIYDQFTVYFEHQRVIHSVVNRATETESTPRRS